ncbi:MAG: patatin family protein [Clostridia bacterium]|nr:patatin family protein [Clostridia bacterium]
MTGIIDVGGGIRGVFSSGIYDAFLDEGFNADYCLGVSAGAANLITYLAKQRGRTLTFYHEYFMRRELLGVEAFLKNGSFLNLDYLYSTLSNEGGENPLDFDTAMSSPAAFKLVITRAKDGKPCYIDKNKFTKNDYVYLKATCCLPLVCKPISIDGEDYYDGGLADPIPYKKAFADGCDKLIVVLTKPRKDYLLPMEYLPLMRRFSHRYPEVLQLAETLHKRNAESLRELEALEKEGKVIIAEPEDCFGMKTLTKDTDAVLKMYYQGYEEGIRIMQNVECGMQNGG